MYHDQGHGPFKVLGIEHGMNVTAGLPDHPCFCRSWNSVWSGGDRPCGWAEPACCAEASCWVGKP